MPDKKKIDLGEALKQRNTEQKPPTEEVIEANNKEARVPPSRIGKRNISGYFSQEVYRQVKIIALDDDKKVQEVLGDALNALFERRGLPPIA